MRFPRLRIDGAANMMVDGTLSYGNDCSIGEGANILVPRGGTLALGDGCYVGRYVELGPSGAISIGDGTSIQDRSILVGDVSVGRHCLLSLNVLISSGRHYFDLHPTWLIRDQDAHVRAHPQLSARHSRPVVIEDDCWIGVNTVVMPGVTIGKGAVVGASSVVVKDVVPYTVVAGAPAKVVKRRIDFVPPRRVSHDNEQDWPYFYKGFELERSSIANHAAQGGIAARDSIVLCLDPAAGRQLHLVARTLDGSSCELSVDGVQQSIAGEFREVVFGRASQEVRDPCVRVRSIPAATTVIVKEAWLQ